MRIDLLPDFAKPFKTKGYDVRKKDNQYYLYKITSKNVEGKKYPVLISEYIGKIDKEKGLIKAEISFTDSDVLSYVEYGLSNFIYSKYKRLLGRSLFNVNGFHCDNIIKLGIVLYLYNEISLFTLKSSFISYDNANELLEYYENNEVIKKRANIISKKINSILLETFKTNAIKKQIEISLKNMIAIITTKGNKLYTALPKDVKQIFIECGVKYD